MARRKPWGVEDGLWEPIEPLLLAVERRFRHPGRRRLEDRKALCGILFVLYTGISWEFWLKPGTARPPARTPSS